MNKKGLSVLGMFIIVILIGIVIGGGWFIEKKYFSTKKEEAMAFSLSVVKAYFKKDCDYVWDSYDDMLFLSGNKIIDKESTYNKYELCDEMEEIVKEGYSFRDYKRTYDIRILNKQEWELEFPEIEKEFKLPTFTDDYYLFYSVPKEGEVKIINPDDWIMFWVWKTKVWKTQTEFSTEWRVMGFLS